MNLYSKIFITITTALFLTGCKTAKPERLPVVPIETNTDTKIVHVERIDTVFIKVPAQVAERTTTEKVSHLETDYAVSDARINDDGTLTHSLQNKTTELPVPAKVTADTICIEKVVEKPVPIEVPVEVERKLSPWHKTRLDTWGWLATALGLCVGWIFRKPIITLARRLLTKTT